MARHTRRKCKLGRRKDGHCRKTRRKSRHARGRRRCPRLGPISKLFKSIGL